MVFLKAPEASLSVLTHNRKVTFDSTIPHVFQTPYQTAPLDFGTDSFYGARKAKIDHLVDFIALGNAERLLEENWNNNFGCQVKWIDWGHLKLEKLLVITRYIGSTPLSKLCKFLATDTGSLDSGWPDLLLWKATPAASQVKLVEVKGPRDRLSDQQRVTIDLLQNCGIDVELCHVVESDGNSKISKFDDSTLYYLLDERDA